MEEHATGVVGYWTDAPLGCGVAPELSPELTCSCKDNAGTAAFFPAGKLCFIGQLRLVAPVRARQTFKIRCIVHSVYFCYPGGRILPPS